MDPWQLATTAQRRINVLAGLALVSWILVCLAGSDSASTERVSASVVSASISRAYAHAACDRPGKRRHRCHRCADPYRIRDRESAWHDESS